MYEPDMKIPIYNSIYYQLDKSFKNSPLNFKTLNNLDLKKVEMINFH